MHRTVAVRILVVAAMLVLSACAVLPWQRHGASQAIDLNRATLRTLQRLPGVTPTMARRIAENRPYKDREELIQRGILTERELDRISDRVTIVEH